MAEVLAALGLDSYVIGRINFFVDGMKEYWQRRLQRAYYCVDDCFDVLTKCSTDNAQEWSSNRVTFALSLGIARIELGAIQEAYEWFFTEEMAFWNKDIFWLPIDELASMIASVSQSDADVYVHGLYSMKLFDIEVTVQRIAQRAKKYCEIT